MPTVKTALQVQPYLVFNGKCEEAMEFYKTAVGAEVQHMMRFSESPEPCEQMPPGRENKVMHGAFKVGETVVMASDGMQDDEAGFRGFSLTLSAPDEETAKKVFAALSVGGQVQMPLAKTFFAPQFGMLADKFGVSWMVIVATECQ